MLKRKIKDMNYYKILLFALVVFVLTSCQDESYSSAPSILKEVQDLKYEFLSGGDSVQVSWFNPNQQDNQQVVIKHTDGLLLLDGGIGKATFGIVKTNVEYAYTVKVKFANEEVYSLGQSISFIRDGASNVSDVVYSQVEDSVFISWVIPEGLKDIDISWKSEDINGSLTLDGDATSCKLVGLELDSYTFKIVTTNTDNQTSHSQYTDFRVGPTKVGFLSQYANLESIKDDDEIAAANWFFNHYENSAFITFDQIVEGTIDLNEFRVLWWHSDEVGGKDLPAIARDEKALEAINLFYTKGGNLLLTVHATMYLHSLGRLPAKDVFAEAYNIADGTGGDNPDTWSVGVILKSFDYSDHAIFKNLTIENGKDIPLIGPGYKEDHNSNWGGIPAMYGYNNDDDAYVAAIDVQLGFVNLGSWNHVGDYWHASIVELKPWSDYSGTAIAIGIGAYEWNQNDHANVYQSQIEGLTKNSIEYLKTR